MSTPTGTALQFTPLAEAGLSPQARMYVATGSPLLYRRATRSEQLHFDASWLYIPASVQCESNRARTDATSEVLLGPSIDLEDWRAHPIFAGAEIVGQLILPAKEMPGFDQSQLVGLAGSLGPELEKDLRSRPSISELFVQSLFQRDNSPQQFTKRLLSLLSLEWPGSCAGAYVEYQGMYHLLLATGEVSRYYRLNRQLSLEKGAQFARACATGEPFVPAELLPDQATFLTSPPDLYYVFCGWKSERSTQYIVIAGPGDLSRRTARRLNEVRTLASAMHESQFHTATDLFDSYQSLSQLNAAGENFDTLLQNATGQLGKQMQLSRVTCATFDSGDKPVTSARVFLSRPTGETSTEVRDHLDIPDYALQKVRSGESVLVPDLTSAGLKDAQARQRYLDNVASEYCMPVKTSQGVVGIVGCGSPVAGDYLTRTVTALSALRGLVSVWTAMNEAVAKSQKSTAPVETAAPDLMMRLTTLRRLTEVSLHGLSETVSAAIGQAELLNDARALDDPIVEAQRQTAAAETLCAIADKLDQHLTGLRRIAALTTAPDTLVNAGEELTAIPAVLGQLLQQLKDSKNIDLRFNTETDKDLLITAEEMYDCFVPIVIAIVEQSICSGQINLQVQGGEHTVRLSMRFQHRLLGGLELPRLLTELFPRCELQLQESGAGEMIIGESTLIIDSDISNEYHITMDCIRGRAMTERDTAIATSTNSRANS
jgi:GAF domain-containing protein